jgi:hypothetical protein
VTDIEFLRRERDGMAVVTLYDFRKHDALTAAIAALEAENCGMTANGFLRFVEWLKDRQRKEPVVAFTAGPVRTAATAVWDSGVLAEMKSLEARLDEACSLLDAHVNFVCECQKTEEFLAKTQTQD